MRFSVVIPTMRREAILEATLESLQHCEQARVPHEVLEDRVETMRLLDAPHPRIIRAMAGSRS